MWALIWWGLTSSAWALGGSFAGELGLVPPSSTATQVAIAIQGERTVITLTAQAAEDIEGFAWLWPAPNLDRDSITRPITGGIEQLEAFTRPRVEQITCDELVDTLRYRTPPGCASYEVPRQTGPNRGEDAIGDVALDATHTTANMEIAILEPVDVDSWLSERGLFITNVVREALQPWFDAGHPVIAGYHEDQLARGDWFEPIRFELLSRDPEMTLPLAGWAAESSTAHQLYVYTLHDDLQTDPQFLDYQQADIEDNCQLPLDTSADDWYQQTLRELEGRAEASWLRVSSSSAERCSPCTSEPLRPQDTADLGVPGVVNQDYRVNRLVLSYTPTQLPRDPRLSFNAEPDDVQTTWVARGDGLGFAFPECGRDLDPTDVCPTIQTEDTRGCSAVPMAPVSALLLVGLVALVRRRRFQGALAAVAAGAFLAATPAQAADDGSLDRRPVLEALVSSGLVGSNRVVLTDFDGGSPGLSSPFLGAQVRWAALGWKDGASVGLVAAIRGWRGRGSKERDFPIRFGFIEPSFGLDVRHGMVRDSGSVSPFVRYGARLAIPVLDPNTSGALSSLTALGHIGVGGWIGRGAFIPTFELRLTVLPRTDGLVTEYHPSLGLPTFTFFPGAANVELILGVGFR